MARIPLPELEDYAFWPPPLRDAMTRFLRTASEALRVSATATPVLAHLLRETGARRIVDLCAGGGGPILRVARNLRDDGLRTTIVLTDKYPNVDAFARAEAELPGLVEGRRDSIDASHVPADLPGIRTIFNGLHHLPPDVARAVFADAVAQEQPIVTFEFVERSVQGLALVASLPLATWAFTPFSKPDWLTLALTYGVPVLPAATTWDGFASCFRAYSVPELEAMVRPLETPHYRFRIARTRVPFSPLFMTTVIGEPCA